MAGYNINDEFKTSGSKEDYEKYQRDRNETMFALQKEKYKEKNADFNVSNYDIEELAAILNFKYLPLNEGIIKDRIRHMKNKSKGQDKFIKFFTDVEVKLLNNLKSFNKQTWEDSYKLDDSQAAKVLQNQFQEKSNEEKKINNNHMLLANDQRVVIGQPRVKPTPKDDLVQGELNEIKKVTYHRLINFDSTFRQILPSVSHSCGGGTFTVYETNTEDRLYSATNYIAHLTEPLTNVVSIEVDKITIPKSWYVFSSNYGTNSFQLETPTDLFTINIQEGNYDLNTNSPINLIDNLNNIIKNYENLSNNGFGLPVLEFTYNPINQKIDISNNYEETDISLNWYIPDVAGSCGGNGAGSKVDYNLGWLLGFRTTNIVIPRQSKYTATSNQSQVDVNGTPYLFITLDDFNNNKPSNVVIAATEPITSGYKLPSYYNDQTMNSNYGVGRYEIGREGQAGFECVDVADENNNERGCATNDLNVDLKSNLTQQQVYSVNQLLQAQNQSGTDRYGSPEPTDLLFTVNDLFTTNFGGILSYTNSQGDNKREYFGPVKLTKFKIRLVNDKGYDVDLNGKDWQFTLRVTQKYQY